VLPIFLELDALHLIGKRLSVILPFAFFPFGVYLAYIYYSTALPADLLMRAHRRLRRVGHVRRIALAAGQARGCARLLLQLRVGLEQLLPALRRTRGLVAVPDSGWAVEPALVDAIIQPGGRRRRSTGEHLPAGLALATLIAVIPVAIVFVLSQRALVRGLVAGAVRG
jgi:multiple sugar transport system permease protein